MSSESESTISTQLMQHFFEIAQENEMSSGAVAVSVCQILSSFAINMRIRDPKKFGDTDEVIRLVCLQAIELVNAFDMEHGGNA